MSNTATPSYMESGITATTQPSLMDVPDYIEQLPDGTLRETGNYWQHIKRQLSGWALLPTSLLAMFAIYQTWNVVSHYSGDMPSMEKFWLFALYFGTLMGGACVTAMGQKKTINGLLGLLSVFAIGANAFFHSYYGAMADQIVFALLIDLPLIWKWRTWGSQVQKDLSTKQWVATFAGIATLTVAWYFLNFWIDSFVPHDAAHMPLTATGSFFDALTLSIGAVASLLCFLKYTQTYNLWMALNFVYIGLWVNSAIETVNAGGAIQSGQYAMLGVTAFYLVNSFYARLVGWANRLSVS